MGQPCLPRGSGAAPEGVQQGCELPVPRAGWPNPPHATWLSPSRGHRSRPLGSSLTSPQRAGARADGGEHGGGAPSSLRPVSHAQGRGLQPQLLQRPRVREHPCRGRAVAAGGEALPLHLGCSSPGPPQPFALHHSHSPGNGFWLPSSSTPSSGSSGSGVRGRRS